MGRANDTKAVDGFTPTGHHKPFSQEYDGHIVPPYDPQQRNPSYLKANNRYEEKQPKAPKGGF